MSRKQRSRAPNEVKKCCRREMGCGKDTEEWRETPSPSSSVPDLHPDVHPSIIASFVPQNVYPLPNLAMDTGVTMKRRWSLGRTLPPPPPPELTVQSGRQAHLQMGSVQSDWAVRERSPGYIPSLLCPVAWSADLFLANKTQREFCCEVCHPATFCFPFLSGRWV